MKGRVANKMKTTTHHTIYPSEGEAIECAASDYIDGIENGDEGQILSAADRLSDLNPFAEDLTGAALATKGYKASGILP
jgi:hypothetical protein